MAVNAEWPAVVFCRTKHGANRLAQQLGREGIDAVAIHGDRSQAQRQRALDEFSRGKVQALVATDVAARGIHVDEVACVVHFDPPEDEKTYVHRSGRTGRAGATGVVVSLVSTEQAKDVRGMQRRLGLVERCDSPDMADLTDESRAARPKPTPERDRETVVQPRSSRPRNQNRNRNRNRGSGGGHRNANRSRRS